MATISQAEKPQVISTFDIYHQHGCTLSALKQALTHGIYNKEKDLEKTLLKQIIPAAGQDQYRLHLHGQSELNAALSLTLARVDKNDNPQDWLEILGQPDYWNAVRLTRISSLLNKAVKRLATHIPKVRNPANEGAPKFAKIQCSDPSAIAAGEATLAVATIEGDATSVGARFFFEFVFYLDEMPTSVLEMLLNKDPGLSAFLNHIGLDDMTINAWHSTAKQTPKQLHPLHAQLLIANANNEWLSITPMLSVATSSWLGQWRKELFYENELRHEGTRTLFAIESVEYGGTKSQNIAAVMMDFAGRQRHPKILPPPVNRDTPDRLARLIHRPGSLINPKKLYGKTRNELSNAYSELPNQKLTQKLVGVIDYLLEDLLEDITHIKSLLDCENEEALTFQSHFNSVPETDPHLLFAQGKASEQDINVITNKIINQWLGSIETWDGTRYNLIKELLKKQLHTYMTEGN
ncbi:MAG: hypothetical protein PHO08_15925 [Methylococcales bacterium]|nr:hypothetical protein [Methylococcales bacterium]MDD5631457.1 hypothetical protein [Methylococcales bacterium]